MSLSKKHFMGPTYSKENGAVSVTSCICELTLSQCLKQTNSARERDIRLTVLAHE